MGRRVLLASVSMAAARAEALLRGPEPRSNFAFEVGNPDLGSADRQQGIKVLRAAVIAASTGFDTAEAYGPFANETLVAMTPSSTWHRPRLLKCAGQ